MTVLAYTTSRFLTFPNGYSYFTGQVDQIISDSATINIGELIYDEFLSLPPVSVSAFGYAYIWKVQLSTNPDFLRTASMFNSNPPRYQIGHLCVSTNSGVTWDDTLRFADQLSPLFKSNFYTDNPNPGDGFPFGTTPLGESVIGLWRTVQADFSQLLTVGNRGSFLGVFLRKPTDVFVRVSYTGFLSFSSFEIAEVAPLPFVVIYS